MSTADGAAAGPPPFWFDDPTLDEPTRAIYGVLAQVWSAATDACSSKDFQDPAGDLVETAYARYQTNVFARATEQLRALGR